MRDEEDGRADLLLHAANLRAQFLAQLRIQIGERLIEQQNIRLPDERAGERAPLLLPTGEFVRIALRQPIERDEAERHLARDYRAPARGTRRTFSG